MGEFFIKDHGTAALEYALLLSLIGMVVIGSLNVIGTNVFDALSTLNPVFTANQVKDDLLPHP
ncbi:MAG: hypothetical protein KC592_19355 [Nitrospira sp.]|nr:hypothetical protein [Nitrospira sp.]HNP30783.1 hypothetical protein [Nitrospirales bacterium]